MIGLLAGYDLDALREKMTRPPFAPLFDALVTRVHAAAEADRTSDAIVPGGWCHSLFFTPAVLEAGLVHALIGDEIAADHVARQIDKLARVYADPPASFYAAFPGLKGKPTAYFSNAMTCLAARMCGAAALGERFDVLRELAPRLIADNNMGDYHFTHFNAGHNAVITHAISSAICALTFGNDAGYADTARAVTLGRDACEMHLTWGFDAQGAPHEGPMYALVTLVWVYLYADLLRRHGGEDLFRTLPRLETVVQAQAEMQMPGVIGFFGFEDCRQRITTHRMPWLLLTAREYDRPRDLALWWQTRGDNNPNQPHVGHWLDVLDLLWWDGAAPATRVRDSGLPTAFIGEGTAVAVLRSSWSDDAVCLSVHGQGRSHNVPDHTHNDAGHVSLYAYGDYLAYDTAYFNFDEDTHSVVLIDGRPRHRTTQGSLYHGRFTRTEHTPWLDYLHIDATSARGVMWAERGVLFIRGADDFAYAVLLDNINVDNGVHDFTWQLQANLHCRVETAERTGRVLGQTARLDCHLFSPLAEDYPTCPHSLRLFADAHPHLDPDTGAPATHLRLAALQTGPNCTLMALLLPRRLDEPALRVTDATTHRTFNAYVEHGEWIDQIVYAPDHAYIRLPDLRAGSEIVVVRRTPDGRVVATWTCDGTPVKV